jgi:phage FluMu protein Com
MTCGKCGGLMIREQFSDYFLVCYAWKCVNCGAVVDMTITKNQEKPTVAESISH